MFVTTWKNLRTLYRVYVRVYVLLHYVRVVKFIEAESRTVAVGGSGERRMELLFIEFKFDEKVLEIDGGCECP